MKDSGQDVKKARDVCLGCRPSILEKVVEIEEEEEEIVWRTTSSRSVSTKLKDW